jgi:hypothetical protein
MHSHSPDCRKLSTACVAAFIAVLLFTCAGVSRAALGGSPERFDAVGATVVSSSSAASANYVTRDTTLSTGTHIREYVSNSGIVFAVVWDGPVLPDLKALLGEHFDTMVAESARMPRAGRSHLATDDPEVVIHSGGHMRAFEGNAWIPAAFPAGFTADDVR